MTKKNNNDLFELMTKMYAEMKDMKTEQKKTNERLDKLEIKVDTGFENLITRIDDISSGIGSVVGN